MMRGSQIWRRFLVHVSVVIVLGALAACAAYGTQPSSSSTQSSKTTPSCSVQQWACTSTYGAIAWSASTRASGIAYNYNSRAEAEAAAIGYCGKSDCATAAWFSNSCGAIATAPTGQMATGLGSTGDFAQASAIASCLQK